MFLLPNGALQRYLRKSQKNQNTKIHWIIMKEIYCFV